MLDGHKHEHKHERKHDRDKIVVAACWPYSIIVAALVGSMLQLQLDVGHVFVCMKDVDVGIYLRVYEA